jgi:general secretion pathway protein M
MNTTLTQLQEWFRSLAPRERLLVSVGSVVVAITILYLGIWEPLSKAHSKRELDLASSQALAQRLEAIAVIVQKSQANGGGAVINTGASLLSTVDQVSKSGTLGKPLTRIQPEGDNEVKVWIDGVSFEALVRWISELESRYGISIQTADLDRDTLPGQVNARLSLVRP